MKKLLFFAILGFLLFQCKTPQSASTQTDSKVTIAKDSIGYDVIVTDIGYDLYLNTVAKPMNFYSQEYYEQKNRLYVPIWNNRVRTSYTNRWRNIFEQEIEYDPAINYGLEVNYKLYNYFKFIEYTYNVKLF